jgi:hypothetical protein
MCGARRKKCTSRHIQGCRIWPPRHTVPASQGEDHTDCLLSESLRSYDDSHKISCISKINQNNAIGSDPLGELNAYALGVQLKLLLKANCSLVRRAATLSPGCRRASIPSPTRLDARITRRLLK